MAEYLDNTKIEFLQWIDDTSVEHWLDISAYVVTDITGEYGLPGESPLDLVADTGYIKFSLNNVDNLFTPDLTTTLVGWKKGAKVKVTCTIYGESWVKFYGRLDDILIDSSDYGERWVTVTCVDWMNKASTFPLDEMTRIDDVTCDEGVEAIITTMPTAQQPVMVTYHTGLETFPYIFDNLQGNTKALTEFQKLAVSELSYIYLRKDRTHGENLVVESRETRDTSELSKILVPKLYSGKHELLNGFSSLLHFEGIDESSDFVDETGKIWSYLDISGTPPPSQAVISNSKSKFGTSAYFNGDSYITSNANSGFNFGTGDFTIDFWVYFNSLPAADEWITLYILDDDIGDIEIWNTEGNLIYDFWAGDIDVSGVVSLEVDTWYHMAVVRNGEDFYLFLDGVQVATDSYADAMPDVETAVYVGGSDYAYTDGFIDEFRISKGIARWTDTFTPPTSAYSLDGNTVSLLHMEGVNGSTVFTDASGLIWSTAEIIFVDPPVIDTALSKFGDASGRFVYDSPTIISTPYTSDFDFGTGDFTVDFWLNLTSYPSVGDAFGLFSFLDDELFAISGFTLIQDNINEQVITIYIDEDYYISNAFTNLTLNTWHHIAYVRHGNTLTYYIDGNSLGTEDLTGLSLSGDYVYVAVSTEGIGSNGLDGYIDELSVCKGTRWTDEFTPPTAAYPYPHYRMLMNGGYKILHQTSAFAFDNNMTDIDVENGNNVINHVVIRVYPRRIDDATSVLYSLSAPLKFEAGEVKTIRGTYKDEYGNPVNATDFVTPVVDTHWSAWTNPDGKTGVDKSDSVVVVATFYADSFIYEITNGDAGIVYLGKLTAEAIAIHVDKPIEFIVKDADSIEKNDYRTVTFDQIYKDSLEVSNDFAHLIVAEEHLPQTVGTKISMIANQDMNSLIAFLCLDIGDLIKIVTDRVEVNASYYITRIGFSISISGIVNYWFRVKKAKSKSTTFWKVSDGIGTYPDTQTHVGYLIVGY